MRGHSPPRGRSDGRHPVKVSASLLPPWQHKILRSAKSSVRERARIRTCSRKPIKACHGGWRFPGTAFPFPSNCHPGPCGLKVHHEIRDPKALCASKNEASKAHSLGALLNSDSATRRSAGLCPKDTRRATSANDKRWVPRHKAEGTRGRFLKPHRTTPPLRQRKILRPAKSPAREQTPTEVLAEINNASLPPPWQGKSLPTGGEASQGKVASSRTDASADALAETNQSP
jgi:hypothetical protein